MTRRLILTPEASDDLIQIEAWLEQPGAGARATRDCGEAKRPARAAKLLLPHVGSALFMIVSQRPKATPC